MPFIYNNLINKILLSFIIKLNYHLFIQLIIKFLINTIYYCKTVKEMSFKLNHKKKFSLRGIQIAVRFLFWSLDFIIAFLIFLNKIINTSYRGKYFIFHSRKTHFYETEFEIFRCAAAKNEIAKGNQQPKGRRLRVFNPFMPVLRYSTGTVRYVL